MKKLITLLFAVVSITTINAQSEKIKGNGKVIKKNVTTSDYDAVSVAGFFDVDLVSGTEGKIIMEGEENLIDHITFEVSDKKLRISTEKGKRLNPSMGKKVVITVPYESLNAVNLSGSGDVTSKGTIKASHFSAKLTGSGDVKLNIDAKDVEAEVTGSGNLILKGKTSSFACEVTGSGDLDAGALESMDVISKVAGSGNCKVNCTGSLQARVTGSGDINYKGDPKKKDTKVSGSGSISKA